MADYAVCENPSCKSNGTSHPNCRCYDSAGITALQSLDTMGKELPGEYRGGRKKRMAKGGEVRYCSGPHKPDCQYYVDGGDAIPSDEVTLDTPPSAPAPTAQSENIPSDQVILDAAPQSSGSEDIPSDEVTLDPGKYETPGQQLLTGIEGGAQGFAGPIATGLELGAHKIGLDSAIGIDTSAEAQAARQEANPWIHGASEAAGLGLGLYTGAGELGILSKVLGKAIPGSLAAIKLTARGNEIVKTLNIAPKLGSAILKGAIESGVIQGGDELSKYLLGQNNDPTTALSAILAAGALGGVGGGMFNLGGKGTAKGLEALQDSKVGARLNGWLAGLGYAADPVAMHPKLMAGLNEIPGFKQGMKAHAELLGKIGAPGIAGSIGALEGYRENGIVGALKGGAEGLLIGAVGLPIARGAGKLAAPVFFRYATNPISGITNMMDHAVQFNRGMQAINKSVAGIFQIGSQQAVNAVVTDQQREKLKEFIANGGVKSQVDSQLSEPASEAPGFAEGGTVSDPNNSNIWTTNHNNKSPNSPSITTSDPNSTEPSVKTQEALKTPVLNGTDTLSVHYPELGMALAAAKGRVNQYLNSIRPLENQARFPFDTKHENPNQDRTYNRAIDIAIQPLSVLNHIKEGSLLPEHVKHMNAMYPELTQHLQKKVTEQILQSQMKGEKPSYKVRQGLSMLMGAPMDSSFTPASIQAAQSVYMAGSGPQAPTNTPAKPKRGTATLSKVANAYATGDQARAQRQQKA